MKIMRASLVRLGKRSAESLLLLVTSYVAILPANARPISLSPMETLGKQIFFDKNLSEPTGQSCSSCHDPQTGFTSPNSLVNVFGAIERGAVSTRSGNRRPPTAAYATFSGNFDAANVRGGTFWDGRATGTVVTDAIFPLTWSLEQFQAMSEHLGPAADQAMGPFLNEVEQNLPSAAVLCQRVASASYASLWTKAWGSPIDCSEAVHIADNHKRVAFAIAVYEASAEFNSFSSLRDSALANDADGVFPLDDFTAEQNAGHDLFYDRTNSCARFCHSSATAADGTAPNERYVRDLAGYFNIGTPANGFNPWYRMDTQLDDSGNIINPAGFNWIDLGIALRDEDGVPGTDFLGHEGKFKVPTLRNVDKRPDELFVRAYTHNGYFKSLKAIVHFYNTRDMRPTCTDVNGSPQRFVPDVLAIARDCWPMPEVLDNVFGCNRASDCKVELGPGETFATYCANPANPRDIGNLCLTGAQEDAIVAYLKTLSDTVTARPPRK